MRLHVLLVSVFLGMATCPPAVAQVSIGIGLPGVSIGINLPVYPDLVPVPGYPVYYAPQLQANFFFYDGLYWVYAQDGWYASRWYNGPWDMVEPNVVPWYVLRVPVRYYRRPPPYFGGWNREAPPRWGDHWGHDWERQHSGWDHWNRASAPAPAPLPTYQRQYSHDRYPSAEQQRQLHQQNYHYQPHEAVVRQGWYQQPSGHAAPAQHPAPTQQQSRQPQAAPTHYPAPEHPPSGPRETAAQHPATTQQQSRPPQSAPTKHPAPEQQAAPRPPQSGQAASEHPPQPHSHPPQADHGAQPGHGQGGGEDKSRDKQEHH